MTAGRDWAEARGGSELSVRRGGRGLAGGWEALLGPADWAALSRAVCARVGPGGFCVAGEELQGQLSGMRGPGLGGEGSRERDAGGLVVFLSVSRSALKMVLV